MQSESWKNESHRYIYRKYWYEGIKEDRSGDIAVVITIRPTNTSAFVEDMTSLLVEKNIRQLEFSGLISLNLFSSIKAKNKATFLTGNDDQSSEVITTILKEKRITQIIFAVGSIIHTNSIALDQAKKIYESLSAKQKKMVKVLVTPHTNNWAHPLNTSCRKEWVLSDFDPSAFDPDSNEQNGDKSK